MESPANQGYVTINLESDRVRFVSGRTVYDEALIDGKWIGRYWNANGQVLPEMHLSPDEFRKASQSFSLNSFHLGVEENDLHDGWLWKGAQVTEDVTGLRNETGFAKVFAISLSHEKHPIDVKICTRLDGSDWIVRWLEITNRGDKATAISSVSPLAGRLWTHKYDNGQLSYSASEAIGDSGESPYAVAYNHLNGWGEEGDLWFEPLKPGKQSFGSRNGKSGWTRPAFWLRNRLNGETFVAELAWSGNWDAQIRYDANPKLTQVSFEIGMGALNGEMLRVLEPGETVRSPAVHAGSFRCGDDKIVHSLHRHVRHTVMPEAPLGKYCEIEANHRGYLCDRENEQGIKADIDIAAEIGAELYMIDAGWYGNEPNVWWNNVGDWRPGPWLPNGLEPIVDYVHRKGMRFGLWVEIEAAGTNSELLKKHPDWLMTRHGQPVANGRALDLSMPEVAQWVEAEIARIIEQYKLDMFRIDHNHHLNAAGAYNRHGFIENNLWRYVDTLYGIFDRIKVKYPNLVLQNCAGGGGRLDLGILQRFHNTEISDWARKPRELRIFNGLTMALPPEIGLRVFGTEVSELLMDGDLDSQLRLVAMSRPIFRGIAPDMAELNPFLKERIRYHMQIHKDFIRPLMKDCLVYHHTPWLPIKKSAPWCVLEYASEDKARSAAAIFRMSPDCGEAYTLYPRGLSISRTYSVRLDNEGESFLRSGFDLVNQGIRINLSSTLASELITFEAVPGS